MRPLHCGFIIAFAPDRPGGQCIANGGGGPDSPYSFEVMYDHRGDGRVSAVERYPCEFCGDVFKADDLLEHQSFCDSCTPGLPSPVMRVMHVMRMGSNLIVSVSESCVVGGCCGVCLF